MKVSSERIAESQVILNMEFEPETVEKSMERAYRRLVTKTNIPGFRKGKAPRAMLERYIGRTALLEEALDILFPEAYEEALKQESIDAVGQPKVEITQMEPVIIRATVPVKPTVVLGNYRDIRFTRETPETTDEQMNEVIEQFRNRAASWEPVERPVAFGDMVTLDVESTVDGKPSGSSQGVQYQVFEENTVPVPGFAAQVTGMQQGEEKEIDIILPEGEEPTGLEGKNFTFKVVVNEIKERKLPDLDDEFAKSVSDEFQTMDDLKARVRDNLQHQAEHEAQDRLIDNILEAVISGSQMEFPPQMTEHEVDHMLQEQEEWVQQRTGMNFEQFLRLQQKTIEQAREDLEPKAKDKIARSLVLDQLAEAEAIQVSPEEIDAEIEKMAASSETPDQIKQVWNTEVGRSSIEQALNRQKTLNRLIEIATEGKTTLIDHNTEESSFEAAASKETADEGTEESK